MQQNIEQQIFEQVKKAAKILIVLPENLNFDALASALALRLFLLKLQKEVLIACSGSVPNQLRFLPGAETVQDTIAQGKSLVISVSTGQKKLEEISYQKSEDKINIYLKSKDAEFDEKDVAFFKERAPLDLIVALGGKSLDDFGKIFEQAADRFFETPKINIDTQASNEYYAAINLVDITATSVSEILTDLFQKFERQLIDEDIATCLLSGIIEKTGSFQHAQTTPRAFLKASELVAMGGRQQEAIKNIFKTKSLSLLKLWGRALARMKILDNGSLVYAVLSWSDFEKAGADYNDIPLVLREFADNLSGVKIFALAYETQLKQVGILAAAHEQVSWEKISSAWPDARELSNKIGGLKQLEINFSGKSLEEAENYLLGAAKII